MASYGQFCSVARAHEVLGGRWTLLVVRELLCGASRFNDIRRGIPRISRTMLSERLQELTFAGAVTRVDGAHGPEYVLTDAGQELAHLVGALGAWGQRWLPRSARDEDNDLEPLLLDMQRRVRFCGAPEASSCGPVSGRPARRPLHAAPHGRSFAVHTESRFSRAARRSIAPARPRLMVAWRCQLRGGAAPRARSRGPQSARPRISRLVRALPICPH